MNSLVSWQGDEAREEFWPEILSNSAIVTHASSPTGCPSLHKFSRRENGAFLEHHSKVPAQPVLVPDVQKSFSSAHMYSDSRFIFCRQNDIFK
jgi:hypothetical protein